MGNRRSFDCALRAPLRMTRFGMGGMSWLRVGRMVRLPLEGPFMQCQQRVLNCCNCVVAAKMKSPYA